MRDMDGRTFALKMLQPRRREEPALTEESMGMDTAPRIELMNWLTGQGLTGSPENELIRGFLNVALP